MQDMSCCLIVRKCLHSSLHTPPDCASYSAGGTTTPGSREPVADSGKRSFLRVCSRGRLEVDLDDQHHQRQRLGRFTVVKRYRQGVRTSRKVKEHTVAMSEFAPKPSLAALPHELLR